MPEHSGSGGINAVLHNVLKGFISANEMKRHIREKQTDFAG